MSIKRDLSTPENRSFWKSVQEAVPPLPEVPRLTWEERAEMVNLVLEANPRHWGRLRYLVLKAVDDLRERDWK